MTLGGLCLDGLTGFGGIGEGVFKRFLFFFWLIVGIKGKCLICVGDGMLN